MSHLRPGFSPEDLVRPAARIHMRPNCSHVFALDLKCHIYRKWGDFPARMSDNLRSRVQQALSQSVHFQYHVGAEDHLAYARRCH